MVCDKVVCERWCVKEGVSKMVCKSWVPKMVCKRWCVKERETKVDVTKCHACHAKCPRVTGDQNRPKRATRASPVP